MRKKQGFFEAAIAAAVVVLGLTANAQAAQEMTINGIECVLVEAGTFMMGATDRDGGYANEYPRHQVTLTNSYWIGKYEVTNAQYKAVIGSSTSDNNYPVPNVDWDVAVAFCAAVGGRLPTEAEWEFAARGGNKSKGYIYSGSDDINAVGWYSGNLNGWTQPVGQKAPNELGIYDMTGNVNEWCNDWYGSYTSSPQTNPTGPSTSSSRVARGGDYGNGDWNCRVALRINDIKYHRGFRIAFNSGNIRKVKFNTNGGSAIADINVPSGAKINPRPSNPTRAGYTFLGWYKETALSNVFDFNSPLTADITLYAKWNRNQYNITYHLNDGANNALNPTTYNIESDNITLQSPTREHYDFKGWYDNANFSGSAITSIPKGSTGDKTLYAKWEIRKYTVKFNSNGGSYTPPDATVNSGTTAAKPSIDPAKTNYIFLGWFRDAEGKNQWKFENDVVTENITLYAGWFDSHGDDKVIFPDKNYDYDGSAHNVLPLNLLHDGNIIPLESANFTAAYTNNVNSGTASVRITGLGEYATIDTTYTFTINKRNIAVSWADTALVFNGNPQSPTATSDDDRFPVSITESSKKTNAGTWTAAAASSDTNIILTNKETQFSIAQKEIRVVWDDTRTFVYNKMVQVPKRQLEPSGIIDTTHLRIIGAYSQVGNYTAQNNLAPVVVIMDEHKSLYENYQLINTSVDYEITKKPLEVVLKDGEGKISDKVSVSRKAGITFGDALDSLKAFIGYDGFATDTVSKQSDDESVLSGAPRFEISKLETGTRNRSTRGEVLKISDLLENGDYVVNIKVSDIFAQNYGLSDGLAVLKVSDSSVTFSMSRDGGTPIRDKKKSDNKHGILLEKAIVSQSAKINVKTPEQAQIMLAVYDNAGNAVYKTSGRSTETFVWNLTNGAGRNVANGTYLVVVEAKGAKGNYAYSAKVGVKR